MPAEFIYITPRELVIRTYEGEPAWRKFGSLTLLMSESEPINLITENSSLVVEEAVAIIPPHTRHKAFTDSRYLAKVLLEPDIFDVDAIISELTVSNDTAKLFSQQLRNAFSQFPERMNKEITDLDLFLFGKKLPIRTVDKRIENAIQLINADIYESLTASECARLAGLSLSRFTHLFKSEIGDTYRGFRAWKRARSYMPFATGTYNLATVAQEIGYADSPHLSRAIKQTYGVTPRELNLATRRIQVVLQP